MFGRVLHSAESACPAGAARLCGERTTRPTIVARARLSHGVNEPLRTHARSPLTFHDMIRMTGGCRSRRIVSSVHHLCGEMYDATRSMKQARGKLQKMSRFRPAVRVMSPWHQVHDKRMT